MSDELDVEPAVEHPISHEQPAVELITSDSSDMSQSLSHEQSTPREVAQSLSHEGSTPREAAQSLSNEQPTIRESTQLLPHEQPTPRDAAQLLSHERPSSRGSTVSCDLGGDWVNLDVVEVRCFVHAFERRRPELT